MRIVIAAVVLAGLSACSTGSSFTPRPVSVGEGPNRLKRTPCACIETKQAPGIPAFLTGSTDEARG